MTKKINITLTADQIEKGKEDSKKMFGKTNLSGYIGVLIMHGFNDFKQTNK